MNQKESQWNEIRVEETVRKTYEAAISLYRAVVGPWPITIAPHRYSLMHRRAQAAESSVAYFAKKYAKVRDERDELRVQLEEAEAEIKRYEGLYRRYADMSNWQILKAFLFGSS